MKCRVLKGNLAPVVFPEARSGSNELVADWVLSMFAACLNNEGVGGLRTKAMKITNDSQKYLEAGRAEPMKTL